MRSRPIDATARLPADPADPAACAGGLVACGLAALALGTLVYLTDRDPARSGAIPAVAVLAGRHWFGVLGQWLPSFVHPFAFGLFTAALLPAGSRSQRGACLAWGAVNMAFEIGQHPLLSARLARALLDGFGPAAPVRALAGYFVRGTFDPGDLAAVVLGTLAALGVLRLLIPHAGDRPCVIRFHSG